MLKINVLIADDHTLVRQGLRQICETLGGFNVVAEADSGDAAVALAASKRPDVILMDIVMPHTNGLQAIHTILRCYPTIRIIALTMYHQESYMVDAIRSGARGYLLKTIDANDLVSAIVAVYHGEYLIDPHFAVKVLSELHLTSDFSNSHRGQQPLTEGEMAVLRLVGQGVENEEIAQRLNLSVHTVANRLRCIFEKLRVHNRTQAALYALRQGWVTLEDDIRFQ